MSDKKQESMQELLFPSRSDFRKWLVENAITSDGVWLVFGKTKEVVSLTANDALEEALCFGWIDGQMKSIDNTKYLKYFARRRARSPWSDKNKKTVEILQKRGIMTELGEKAVENAKRNGEWDAQKSNKITDEQVEAFAEKLVGISPAHDNFKKMSRSIQLSYAGRYLSFKTEEARQRDFEKIIDRLNNNLKPM